jgi:hypothetical protein
MISKLGLIGAALLLTAATADAAGWGNRATANANAAALAQSQSSSHSSSSSQGGNATNNNTNNWQDRKQAPGIGIPGLTSGALTCLGSVSGGLSVAGFGAGLGTTYLERNCEARAVADQVYRYGYRRQAINLLISEHPMVRRAFAASNAQRPATTPRKKSTRTTP